MTLNVVFTVTSNEISEDYSLNHFPICRMRRFYFAFVFFHLIKVNDR